MSRQSITVTVGVQEDGSTPNLSCSDPLVEISGSTVTVNAYYTNTQITFQPACDSGLNFGTHWGGKTVGPTQEGSVFDCKNKKETVICTITNDQRKSQGQANVNLDVYQGDTTLPLFYVTCWFYANPRKLITVNFAAGGSPQFTYSGDIDTTQSPPSVTVKQKEGVMFTLAPAAQGTIFTRDPFVWDNGAPDTCIAQVNTDGMTAVLTDLYYDGSKEGTQHGFRLQVTSGGTTYLSEDPTVVNVEPPPD